MTVVIDTCNPAMRPLADRFAAAVGAGRERGALCVMRQGEVLLDIRGGEAAPGRPWQADTLACCFSVTKGVLSLLTHRLIDEAVLSPATRIARLWPEFAGNGKSEITLADVLTHRAGLPAVSGRVRPGDLYDPDRMVALLAASAPVVPVRDLPVYHNMTYGHLLGAILSRATGLALPVLLAERVTGPLGADFRLGLTPAEEDRTACLTQADPQALWRTLRDSPDSLFSRSMAFFAAGEDFNSRRWRSAVIGSGSGHATARAIAALYGHFVWPGLLSGQRRRSLCIERAVHPADPVLGLPIRYGEGVELSTPPGLDFGPDPATIGHWGAGGATGLVHPASGYSLGYVTGHMSAAMGSSGRARSYVQGLFDLVPEARS